MPGCFFEDISDILCFTFLSSVQKCLHPKAKSGDLFVGIKPKE